MESILITAISVEELRQLVKEAVAEQMAEYQKPSKHTIVKGYKGLARELKCSPTTIFKLLKSGKLDGAVIRQGRLVLFDTNTAIEMLNQKIK